MIPKPLSRAGTREGLGGFGYSLTPEAGLTTESCNNSRGGGSEG